MLCHLSDKYCYLYEKIPLCSYHLKRRKTTQAIFLSCNTMKKNKLGKLKIKKGLRIVSSPLEGNFKIKI